MNNYLNRAAFTSPAAGTYSTLTPFTSLTRRSFQNDFALTRTFKLGGAQTFQFRWEVFNVINHVELQQRRSSALNSASFGQILTAGAIRVSCSSR